VEAEGGWVRAGGSREVQQKGEVRKRLGLTCNKKDFRARICVTGKKWEVVSYKKVKRRERAGSRSTHQNTKGKNPGDRNIVR